MRRTALFVVALLVMGVVGLARAHEVRPGYLELRQTGPEIYDVLWKVPARGDLRLGLYVRLPENCQPITPKAHYGAGGAFLERWTIRCAGKLAGRTIAIEGLSTTLTDVLVRLEGSDGTSQVARLTPSAPAFVVEAAPTRAQVAGTYLRLGVEHILGGIDHLLFVLALLLIVKGRWLLLKTITAFTVAHSITLAVATLGFVHVPSAPVEAVIALSIVFLGSEIAHSRMGKPGLTQKYPWVVAFTFGLLHGFGFAGALAEIGLPQGQIPLALLLFNGGVEVGQLMFIGTVLGLMAAFQRFSVRLPAWAWRVPTYAIGSIAAYWLLTRTTAFW
ncbi:MAG: HupE/UreJ family protein [Acidimicrobiia bacterium]